MPAVRTGAMTIIAGARDTGHRHPRPAGAAPCRRSSWRLLALAVVTAALAGCVAPGERPGAAARVEAQPKPGAAVGAAEFHEPRYLRYRPDETGLIAVFDDGRDTYLEFRDPVSSVLTLHDTDGRLLAHVASGQVAAVPGLYTGLLVRIGNAASYASPNPRRTRDLSRELPERIDFVEARVQLHSNADLQAAMARALQAADGVSEADSPAAAAAAAVRAARRANRIEVGKPLVVEQGPTGRLAPLAAANLSTLQPERGLIRVYFARGSRAIVAPDDGLGVLLRDAPHADRIRITGFTDADGTRAGNLALARSRADAVAQILLRRGIDPVRIELDAVVEEAVSKAESERGRAMSRRAEVQLLRDGRPLNLGALR